jgi:tetratricopeptide (TPR) repeat protein
MGTRTASYFLSRGNDLYFAGKFDEAITAYTRALGLNPKNAVALSNRGCVYDDKKLFDLAIADLTAALKIDSQYTDAFYNRGIVYEHKELWDLAIKDYTEAIEQWQRKKAGAGGSGGAIRDSADTPEINHNLAKAFTVRGKAYKKRAYLIWRLRIIPML